MLCFKNQLIAKWVFALKCMRSIYVASANFWELGEWITQC